MNEKIMISKDLYDYINVISLKDNKEEIMFFGGNNIENHVYVNDKTFKLFDEDLIKRDRDKAVIYVNTFVEELNRIKENGCDVMFMIHSHFSKYKSLEFMYGDLSDDDEEISKKLRSICNKYDMDYFDGITTGNRLYFWSTKGNKPKLLDCFVDYDKVKYNRLTEITEKIEHRMK